MSGNEGELQSPIFKRLEATGFKIPCMFSLSFGHEKML